MGNKNSGWLNLIGVICYFMGISCITTLILIPFGIYCFIGGSKYFAWANMTDTELYNYKNSLRNWAIYVSIIAFPIGLVSLIPVVKIGNNPVVTDVKTEQKDQAKQEESLNKAEEMGIKAEENQEPTATHETEVTSKEETIKKLEKFKNDGLITESEFKKAVAELNKE